MDRILVQMPSTLREFLVAVSVMQEYSVQLVIGVQRQERAEFEITFRMDEKFKYLTPCLQVVKEYIPMIDHSGWDECIRGDFDQFIEFNFDVARNVSKANRRHVTDCFSAILGVEMNCFGYGTRPMRWPILGPLQLPRDKHEGVLIISWDAVQSEHFYEFLLNNYPELELMHVPQLMIDNESVQALIEYVNEFDVVVAPAGAATYIAAALGKTVIEIFPSTEDSIMWCNIGLPYYEGVVGTHVTAEFLWMVWESIWAKHQEHTNVMRGQGIIPTGQLPSIVPAVEEKSSDSTDPLSGPSTHAPSVS